MAYDNNTIANADGSGQLIAAIETLMTAHNNWTQVEAPYSITTEEYHVWKNSGTGTDANTFGTDFYIAMIRTSATAMRFICFEAYTLASGTPANARMIRPCMHDNSSARVPQTDGSFGSSSGVAMNNTNTQTNNSYVTMTLNTTGFEYFIILSRDYLRVGCRVGVNDGTVDMGLFSTLLPGGSGPSETFPLFLSGGNSTGGVVSVSWSTSNTGIACSRHPNLPDQTSRAQVFGHTFEISNMLGPVLGGPTSAIYDRYQGTNVILYGIPGIVSQSASNAATLGYARGRPKDLVLFNVNPTARIGDEFTLGTDVYCAWLYTVTSARGWVKKSVT